MILYLITTILQLLFFLAMSSVKCFIVLLLAQVFYNLIKKTPNLVRNMKGKPKAVYSTA